jgi:hypothetical protein
MRNAEKEKNDTSGAKDKHAIALAAESSQAVPSLDDRQISGSRNSSSDELNIPDCEVSRPQGEGERFFASRVEGLASRVWDWVVVRIYTRVPDLEVKRLSLSLRFKPFFDRWPVSLSILGDACVQ